MNYIGIDVGTTTICAVSINEEGSWHSTIIDSLE